MNASTRALARLGVSTTAVTPAGRGYPWVDGDILYADDLNAAFVSASDGAINVLDFGAKVDGTGDDSLSLSAAITAALAQPLGGKVIIPAGRMVLGSAVGATVPPGKSLTIEGVGLAGTELYFPNNTDGLSFVLANSGAEWGSLGLYRFTLTRGATSPVSANTALSVSIPPGAMYDASVVLRDLRVRGVAGNPRVNQWRNSVVLAGMNGAVVDNIAIFATNSSATDNGDVLLLLTGGQSTNQYATSFNITNCIMVGGSAGIDIVGWVQGVFISNCTVIGQYDGIRWVDDGSHFAEELAIVNCTLNAGHRGILISHGNQNAIANTTILHFNTGVAVGWAGMEIGPSFLNGITGNNIVGANSGPESGIIIRDCGNGANTVIGNAVTNITGVGIWLQGSTSGATVVGNGQNGGSQAVIQESGGNIFSANTWNGTAVATAFPTPIIFTNPTGVPRFFTGVQGTESGGNTGSDYTIIGANDTGGLLGNVLTIHRLSGEATFKAYGNLTHLTLDATDAANLIYSRATIPRWFVGTLNTETGGNTGSDFQITSAADSGAILNTPLSINRATGVMTFLHAPVITSLVSAADDAAAEAAGVEVGGIYLDGRALVVRVS